MREDAMGSRYEYGQTAQPSLSSKRERSLTCMCRTWIWPKEATAVDGAREGEPTHASGLAAQEELSPQERAGEQESRSDGRSSPY